MLIQITKPCGCTGNAGTMPNARYSAIPGAGHAAQTERPAEAAALVIEFIQNLESESSNG